jgi:hypothetical protein
MDCLRPVRVALHPSLASSAPEAKYALRTLLRTAGLPYEFAWLRLDEPADIYYGPPGASVDTPVQIASCGRPFAQVARQEPLRFVEEAGLGFLDFAGAEQPGVTRTAERLVFANDIVLGSYWLLAGGREPDYPRDRYDNLGLDGSFFLRHALQTKPLVSVYASHLRAHFRSLGREPLELPWTSSAAQGAFALSHDVDYPQMIRWIECLRLLHARGLKGLPSIAGVLRGTNHFWKFAEWVDFARSLGAPTAFYFMARKGSLPEYALGTPDAFYDIRDPEFASLFRSLRDQGCEVGLHASFHAHRSVRQLRWERQRLAEASGAEISGVRHHFWHLDPLAPHETLRRLQEAGFAYDMSLAFEFYPGFRRGSCHPFRVYHSEERRELNILELPTAWMDDHFDRRLARNGISDPEGYARSLLDTARATSGVIVLDYHVRGMNQDFFPRYGRWLVDFARKHVTSSFSFHTPGELARLYGDYERTLEARSRDLTNMAGTAAGAVALSSATTGGTQ